MESEHDVTPVGELATDQSLDATLNETFDKLESGEIEPTPGPEVHPRRNEKGQFVSRQGQVSGGSQPAAQAEQAEEAGHDATEADPVPPKGDDERLNTFKKSLKANVRDEFDRLSPELKADLMRRNEDFHKGIEQYKAAHQLAQDIQQAAAPYAATLQAMNLSPAVALQRLLAADHAMRYGDEDARLNAALHMAAAYRLSPEKLLAKLTAATQPTQNTETQAPPATPAVPPELVKKVTMLEQALMTREQQEQLRHRQEAEEWFQRFASETTPDGKLKHEFIDDVRQDVIDLVAQGKAETLEQAYEMAVWARADTRATLIARQQQREREEASRKAQEAKRTAGVALTTRGTQAPVKKPAGKMYEDLSDLYDKLQTG